jgi:hypothetical protein
MDDDDEFMFVVERMRAAIARLRACEPYLIDLQALGCPALHHAKKDQHGDDVPACPVATRLDELLADLLPKEG